MASNAEDSRGDWERSFNSFSGCDILAIFAGKVIGELQGITYTIQREKVPLYTMGTVDPLAYSRGKRGIAGSMVFLTFDRQALMFSLKENANAWLRSRELRTRSLMVFDKDLALNERSELRSGVKGSFKTGAVLARAYYADQVPPFNVVLTAANEYGGAAVMSIVGCEIVNDGSSVSVDDPVLDQSMTYVCRTILGWEPLEFKDPALGKAIDVAGTSNIEGLSSSNALAMKNAFSQGSLNLVGTPGV